MSRRIQSQLLVLKYEGTPRDAYTLIIRTDQSLTDLTLFRDAFSLAGKTLFYKFPYHTF